MIIIHFGLELTDRFSPVASSTSLIANERSFLSYLETQLSILPQDKEEFMRVEQFRQLLQSYLETNSTAFFAASFAANGLATANMLLQMRDELLLSNWDFVNTDDCPMRLKLFSGLETLLSHSSDLPLNAGFADRFVKVERALANQPIWLDKVMLTEPMDLLPCH